LKGRQYEDNAWFVGFAPYRNPEIVVAAMVENAGHGGTFAAPITHAVFETYYKKKMGTFDQPSTPEVAQAVRGVPNPGGR
jgi:cell division protein FtsI/penicillin-binding protein 2